MKNILKNILIYVEKIETLLSICILGLIVLIMGAQVTMRYIFNSPLTWAAELSILLLIYLTFISADIAYRKKSHIRIDYFVNLLHLKNKKIIKKILYFFIFIFLITIFTKSIVLIKLQADHAIAAVLPLSKSFWILPVALIFPSMALTTIYFILYGSLHKQEDEGFRF
jgi:TRAP-type C4-dicarboxylate transport system permease small subunit